MGFATYPPFGKGYKMPKSMEGLTVELDKLKDQASKANFRVTYSNIIARMVGGNEIEVGELKRFPHVPVMGYYALIVYEH